MKQPKFLATKLKNGKYCPKIKFQIELNDQNDFYDPTGFSFSGEYNTEDEAKAAAKKWWEERQNK